MWVSFRDLGGPSCAALRTDWDFRCLFSTPTCRLAVSRPSGTLLLGAHRPLEDKRAVTAAISELVVEALGVPPDDIFVALIPVPNENFSFGRGDLQLAQQSPRW
ncbi:tautomerase family protein [Streptomyces sp. NPDC052023]|uniref:tautomerase family protein n=1 Tax=Streptomyces sp. NPDC052023 TaxID=3365681 RepID=UPI0037CD8D36